MFMYLKRPINPMVLMAMGTVFQTEGPENNKTGLVKVYAGLR